MWKQAQSLFAGEQQEDEDEELQENFLEDTDNLCSLSPTQRLYGFAACSLAGLVCMFLLVWRHKHVMVPPHLQFDVWLGGNHGGVWQCKKGFSVILRVDVAGFFDVSMIVFAIPIKFALLFTFGNLLAVGSTTFLMGATRQLQMMFDPVRLCATTIYIGFVLLALICALWIHDKLLTLLAILCEICALIWYSLSYIPFARAMVSKVTIRLFDTEI